MCLAAWPAGEDIGPAGRHGGGLPEPGKLFTKAPPLFSSSRLQERTMTSLSVEEVRPLLGNPIDLVEEFVIANDWAHDRASEDELIVEISGRWCDYRLYFLWQEELSALHFSAGFDMRVPERRRDPGFELLSLANETLWLGHF